MRSDQRARLARFVCFTLLLLAIRSTLAQEAPVATEEPTATPPPGRVIAYGDVVQGRILEGQANAQFSFVGATDDFIEVRVIGLSPDLQPSLSLLTSTQIVTSPTRIPISPTTNYAMLSTRLPADNTYIINVMSATGLTGSFVILLEQTPPDATVSLSVDVPINLQTSQTIPTINFVLSPAANTTLTINTNPTELRYYAVLRDALGQEVIRINPKVDRLQVDLPISPTSEQYELLLTPQDTNQVGEFQLTLAQDEIISTEPSGEGLATATPAVETATDGTTDDVTTSDCTNEGVFVADVTIPDGTEVAPNEPFLKQWRVQNTGTCNWDGYQLVRVTTDAEIGLFPQDADVILMPTTTAGQQVDVAVQLVIAPGATTGSVKSLSYELRDPSGTPVGGTDPLRLFAEVIVNDTAVNNTTVLPTPTMVTAVDNPSDCVNDSVFVADVTIPDGTPVNIGESFTKTWSIQNVGTCAWVPGYELVRIDTPGTGFIQGVGANTSVLIPQTLPNSTINVEVALTTRGDMPVNTVERANFQLQDATGNLFGATFYVEIEGVIIVDGTPNPASETNVTVSPTPAQQTVTNDPNCTTSAAFVSDFPVEEVLFPGSSFIKSWEIQNTGTCTWDGFTLVQSSGDVIVTDASSSVSVIPVTAPGETVQVTTFLVVANTTAIDSNHRAVFDILDQNGNPIGLNTFLEVFVNAPE